MSTPRLSSLRIIFHWAKRQIVVKIMWMGHPQSVMTAGVGENMSSPTHHLKFSIYNVLMLTC